MYTNRYHHRKGEWVWAQAFAWAGGAHARIGAMANLRTWMEKAIRSAIQRHHRGWNPYPHVRVVETSGGHRVHWSDANNLLSKKNQVVVESTGMPSKRDFRINSVVGTRMWTSDDGRMMERDEHLAAVYPLALGAKSAHVAAMSTDDCRTVMEHLVLAWKNHPVASQLMTLVQAQHFSPSVALRTSLDALACVPQEMIERGESCIVPFARIAVGHAMQSQTNTWSSTFGHVAGKWTDMKIVAWGEGDDWRMCIIPAGNPIVYSDYAWSMTGKGVHFLDKLSPGSPHALWEGRGSYERYQKLHRFHEVEEREHFQAFTTFLSNPIVKSEPDETWTKPIAQAVASGLHKKSGADVSPEYYSLMRAFEECAFDFLRKHASTPEGQAVVAAMHVARTLEESPRNVVQWFPHLERWGLAISGVPALDMHDFSFEASV